LQRDPATSRAAGEYDEVPPADHADIRIQIMMMSMISGGLVKYSG
jgi:hypothetical protein